MRYVIDTCVISELSARRPNIAVTQWFNSVSDGDLFLSAVTLGELNDDEIAMTWGQVLGNSIRIGKTRPATDAQIAATAIYYGMTLVTRNVRDFLHTGVNVVNPFDE